MSEYKCQEPGCHFHIGIAGDLVTEQDFEMQDYYDQEVEEHYQMHADERKISPGQRLKELREAFPLHQSQLAKRLNQFGLPWNQAILSKVERDERPIRLEEVPYICLALGIEGIQDFWTPGPLKPPEPKGPTSAIEALAEIRKVLAQLDSIAKDVPPAGVPAEGESPDGPEERVLQESLVVGTVDTRSKELNRSARKHARGGSLPAGLVNMRLELDGEVFDAVMKSSERPRLDGLRTIEPVVLEGDSRHGVDPERHIVPGVGEATDGLALTSVEEIYDADFQLPKFPVGHSEPERAVADCMDESAHDSSLSVDVPNGTVVSAPESTERGQTPASPEKEKPSAGATAEGDETKTNQ